MKRTPLLLFLLFLSGILTAQQTTALLVNKDYPNVKLGKIDSLLYDLKLEKGSAYQVRVLQQNIDAKLFLSDDKNTPLLDMDSPNGQNGFEIIEFTPQKSGHYHLKIVRLEEDGNPQNGMVSIFIKKNTAAEMQEKEMVRKELEPENKKTVQTLDIDHFWAAFDKLKDAKSRRDSIDIIQKMYLDRATDGLKDFMVARQFTAEKFIKQIATLPKFYNSVRQNTYEAKKAAPAVEEIVNTFRKIYPHFKEKKICFAIGLVNTGGTVSDNFLLIGTEVTTSTASVDLSEFNNSSFSKVLGTGTDVFQKIRNMVSHEYVHTQQTVPLAKTAIVCPLLYAVLNEGSCDFIGELVSGSQINEVARAYGDAHEKELWLALKAEMCSQKTGNWIYNYSTVKDKPADLGYYMGYKIAAEYYRNALDKKQAIVDIIEMNDPIKFLQLSGYDQKEKK